MLIDWEQATPIHGDFRSSFYRRKVGGGTYSPLRIRNKEQARGNDDFPLAVALPLNRGNKQEQAGNKGIRRRDFSQLLQWGLGF